MFDFTDMMNDHVGRFTIGFVAVKKDKGTSLGSGTLARYPRVRGIITCAHVLQSLLRPGVEIGVVCFPTRKGQLQMTRLDMSKTDHVIVGTYTETEFGPDLAFLRLPESVFATLESLASSIDATRHRENALAGEPDDGKNRVELVCGIIEERSTTRTEGNMAVTTFEGLLNVGRVVNKTTANSLDLYSFQPVPGPDATPPKSYGGTSGGGLWRVYTDPQDDGTHKLAQARMVGVAFWEKPVDAELYITCHGQQSVHHLLYDEVMKKWP
jgi:hypothetical protein